MEADEAARRDGSALSEVLGPLPEAALTVVHNAHTMERQVSTHGVAYYGSNWYAERECYTADQMRAYALQERKRIKDIVTKAALTQAPLDAEEWTSPEAAFQAAVKSMALDIILRIDGYVPIEERGKAQQALDLRA